MSNAERVPVYQPEQDSKNGPVVAPVEGREKTGRIIDFPQNEKKERDEEFEQRISQWSKKWIEDFYNNTLRNQPNISTVDEFSTLISRALGNDGFPVEITESNNETKDINKKEGRAEAIFIREFVNFIENEEKKESEKETIKTFLQDARGSLFEHLYQALFKMDVEDLFPTVLKMNRIESIQGLFGRITSEALAWKLIHIYYKTSDTKELESVILKQDMSELLDSVNYIQSLSQLVDCMSGRLDMFKVMLNKIKNKIQTPLIKYAIEITLDNINPEKTFYHKAYDNQDDNSAFNKRLGKLEQEIKEEDLEKHNELSSKIIPDREVWFNEKLLPISSDVVGIFDHSNILRNYSKLDYEELSREAGDSFIRIQNVIVVLKKNQSKSQNEKIKLLTALRSEKIISENDFEDCNKDYDQFVKKLIEKGEQLQKTLPLVHFNNLEKISSDEQVNPFAKDANEDEILLFQQLHVPEMRKAIEKDLGIELTEIPLRSQFYLLQYISDKEGVQYGQLQQCLQKNQQAKGEIAHAFLIAAEKSQYADAILEIANEYEEGDLKGIFLKYREIAEGTRQMEALMQAHFKQEKEFSVSQIQLTARTVLQKANEVLLDFAGRIKNGEVLDEDKLEQKLESIKADQIFFTSVFKNFAKNNPEASFEDFKGLSLETMSSPEVKKYSERFFEIANENNQNENPIVQEIVRKGLEKGLENEKTVFDVLLKDEDPIALQRFDDEGTYYYYGSVNVDVKYHGSAIFEQMKKESLDRRAKEKPIKAHCNSANFVSSQYVENSGFVIDGTVLDGGVEEKDGRTVDNRLFTFAIERDEQKNGNYQYRQHVSTEQLKVMENQLREDLEAGKESRKELVRNRKPFVISFEENQRPTFFKLAEKLTKEYGYVISRYFFEGKTGGKFFAGFEQKL